MSTGFLEMLGGLAAFALCLFALSSAVFALSLTVCGTFAFWSWVLGGPGFVAMCLS